MLLRQHAACRLLGDEEGAIGGDRERFLHVERINLDEGAAGTKACIVDDDVRRPEGGIDIGEQLIDVPALGCVAGERPPADFFDEPIEVAGGARSERHLDVLFGQRACEGGAQPGTYAHDERGIEFDIRHGEFPVRVLR